MVPGLLENDFPYYVETLKRPLSTFNYLTLQYRGMSDPVPGVLPSVTAHLRSVKYRTDTIRHYL